MLTVDYLSRLSDRELLTVLHAERDSLTVAPAELALSARLEAIVDSGLLDLEPVLDEFGATAADVKNLLDAGITDTETTIGLLKEIGEHGIENALQLRHDLEFTRKFFALVEDAGEVFTRLAAFLQPTNQESLSMSIEKTIAENTAAVIKLTETLLALNLQPAAAQPEAEAAKKPDAPTEAAARTPRTAVAGDASDEKDANSDGGAPPADEPAAQTASDADEAPVTYGQASAAVTGLAKTKGRAVAIDVLKKFGASKLPEVKPEQFAALIKACAEA